MASLKNEYIFTILSLVGVSALLFFGNQSRDSSAENKSRDLSERNSNRQSSHRANTAEEFTSLKTSSTDNKPPSPKRDGDNLVLSREWMDYYLRKATDPQYDVVEVWDELSKDSAPAAAKTSYLERLIIRGLEEGMGSELLARLRDDYGEGSF